MARTRSTFVTALAGGAVCLLLSVGLTPGASAAPPPPVSAAVMQATVTPKIQAARASVPYAAFGKTAQDSQWALDWSIAHPKKSQRNPVPYPWLGWDGGGDLANLPHTTYAVYYTTVSKDFVGPVHANKVWKYGITSIPHYQTRANVGRSACNKWAKARGDRQECRRTWVSVSQANFGWDYGRFMEASLIKEYQRKYGVCPPGQSKSCR
jgi:hypothetical protein